MSSLPNHILKSLSSNKTSLGDHPAFPPEDEEKFAVRLLSNTFERLTEKVDADYDTLSAELGRLVSECRKLERDNVQALEQLCEKIISDMFDIPQDTLEIEANIVDKVDTSSERMIPEKTENFSFDDIEDMNRLTDEIYKRRMLDALVTGASLYYMNFIGNYIKEIFEINSDLPSLYKKIIDYNNVLIYISKDSFNEKGGTDGGKVDVTVSSSSEYPTIKAEGLIFPILFEETVRGILELAVSHGLPESKEKAKYIIGKSDFKLAEVWDMRLGYALWNLIEDEVSECGYDMDEIGVNFFLMELSTMDCDSFNSTLKEIFARTKKGRKDIDEMVSEIEYNKDRDEFDDFMDTSNTSAVQINDDDCFTPEELITDCETEEPTLYESGKKKLEEAEYNYHFDTGGGKHDMKPYRSDNKYVMPGRETGHFGSGTYFSTYPKEGLNDKYSSNKNPNFIQIDDKVYRVDFDLYKNLYRVRSKSQGDILYTMCKNLNRMYSRMTDFGHFNPKTAQYNNSDVYQIIKKNADALNLKCPSYYELTRMAQRHDGDQSFSTLFMEYNGYNGVNVSGIPEYDNTKHGSVIYDLSKTNSDMEEVKPKNLYTGYKYQSYDDTVARDYTDDYNISALKGEEYGWYEKLGEMSLSEALRLLKNYTMSGNVLDGYIISQMNDELKKRYLRILYSAVTKNWPLSYQLNGNITYRDNLKYIIRTIIETQSYYWVNLEMKNNSILVRILDNFTDNQPWDLSIEEDNKQRKQFLENIMGYMKRELTDYERQYIEEDYYI